MQIDLFGNKRFKVNLHTHTTCSDGKRTPQEAADIYAAHGYDAVALTDHWKCGEERTLSGVLMLSGAEYNNPSIDSFEGVFHIVGVGMKQAPALEKGLEAQELIDGIHQAGGIAILGHPAWSLNTLDQIMPLRGVDATEIYNSVSGVHMSRRADSSQIVDMLATRGRVYPLLASDDTHYYDGSDECVAWSMVKAEECASDAILAAVKRGDFYATQGPEVHLMREGDEFTVKCSPCREIIFHSNIVWSPRVFEGEDLTEARYTIRPEERYIRAEVVDANGKHAWTNVVLA